MTDEDVKKLRTVVKEEINTALKPIKKTLDGHTQILDGHTQILDGHTQILEKHTQKLDILWDQTVRLTEDVDEIKDTLNSHTKVLKRIEVKVEHNTEDTGKVDKRLHKVENHLGIVPPPELTIAR